MSNQVVYYPIDLTQDDRQTLIEACGSHLELLEISDKADSMATETEKVAAIRERLTRLTAQTRSEAETSQ